MAISMADMLKQASEDINKGNGGIPEEYKRAKIESMNRLTDGEQRAVQLREAGERTARAIEEQAQQRVAIAMSEVETANARIEMAKAIANDVRKDAEAEAQRAIDRDNRNRESEELLQQIAEKFSH